MAQPGQNGGSAPDLDAPALEYEAAPSVFRMFFSEGEWQNKTPADRAQLVGRAGEALHWAVKEEAKQKSDYAAVAFPARGGRGCGAHRRDVRTAVW